MTKRYAYLTVGCVALFLGVFALVMPVVPAVPFIIVSGFCFARGSERFHTWLTMHRFFGPMLRSQDGRIGISPRNTLYYLGMILVSAGISAYVVLEVINF